MFFQIIASESLLDDERQLNSKLKENIDERNAVLSTKEAEIKALQDDVKLAQQTIIKKTDKVKKGRSAHHNLYDPFGSVLSVFLCWLNNYQ